MTTLKGISGTNSKQKDSGKIGCLTDEADASRMPDVSTGDTLNFYNNEMHTFTTFYVRATNDV